MYWVLKEKFLQALHLLHFQVVSCVWLEDIPEGRKAWMDLCSWAGRWERGCQEYLGVFFHQEPMGFHSQILWSPISLWINTISDIPKEISRIPSLKFLFKWHALLVPSVINLNASDSSLEARFELSLSLTGLLLLFLSSVVVILEFGNWMWSSSWAFWADLCHEHHCTWQWASECSGLMLEMLILKWAK